MKTTDFFPAVRRMQLRLMLLALFCFMKQVHAGDINADSATQNVFHQAWERASDEELASLRGGFILPNGIQVDMSLEKFIHLNDVLVHSSSVHVPGEGVLLQAGGMNSVSGSVAVPQLSTFIQNTLDSQHIDALTKINIDISNVKGATASLGNHRMITDYLAPALSR